MFFRCLKASLVQNEEENENAIFILTLLIAVGNHILSGNSEWFLCSLVVIWFVEH